MPKLTFPEALARALRESREHGDLTDAGHILELMEQFRLGAFHEIHATLAKLRPIYRDRIGKPPRWHTTRQGRDDAAPDQSAASPAFTFPTLVDGIAVVCTLARDAIELWFPGLGQDTGGQGDLMAVARSIAKAHLRRAGAHAGERWHIHIQQGAVTLVQDHANGA